MTEGTEIEVDPQRGHGGYSALLSAESPMIRALLILLLLTGVALAEPARDKGLSLHMLPDRVAKLDGKKGGFTVTEPGSRRDGMTYSDVSNLVALITKLSEDVRNNGVWIVYTHPSAYSDEEKARLKDLIAAIESKKLRVFTCRASKLRAGGWKEGEGITE